MEGRQQIPTCTPSMNESHSHSGHDRSALGVVSYHSTNDTTLTLSLGQERVQSCGVFPPLSTVLDRSQKYCGWMDGWIDS
mmetsp:Transcript_39511/g.44158  ORF Transcript_39511/g.44158 Transcript_39511/m.44158 type:complete len:80 (+) Transcript_39511:599-838(+)